MKFFVGFMIGSLVDDILTKKQKLNTKENIEVECCHHHHHNENHFLESLSHIFFHSLEVFLYVFVVNILFLFFIFFRLSLQLIS